MFENTEEAIKREQSREIGNIGYTWRRKPTNKYMLDTNVRKQTQ